MKKEYKNNYITFYPKKDKRGFCISYSPWSYFDSRPEIMTYLSSILTLIGFLILGFSWYSLLLIPTLFFSWGQIFIHIPYDSGNGNTAEYPTYSLDFYSLDGELPNHIWIRMTGYNSKTIYLPWAYNWYRTSLLLKDGTWENETKGNRKEF